MTKVKLPLHRNPKISSLLVQVFVLSIVVFGNFSIYQTTVFNLQERGIKTSSNFFDDVAPFKVGFSPFLNFELGKTTYIEVFYIGILNTLLVALLGIFAATILGFIIGILRLSPNWIASKMSLIYIEVFRNVPLLLQIMFWNFAVFLAFLPPPKKSIEMGLFYLNSRGLHSPLPFIEDNYNFTIWIFVLIIAVVLRIHFSKWAKKKFELTGIALPVKTINFLSFLAIARSYIISSWAAWF